MIRREKGDAFVPGLQSGFERLLGDYRRHCRKNGLREGSIELYEKECRWFLHNLENGGCTEPSRITASKVVAACLALSSNSYLSTVRTFLRYCAESGEADRDYSYVVPPYKRPQPIPSVYSEDEILRMESAVDRSVPVGKRDYAIILFATRLGLRLEDIRTMGFDELDFGKGVIRLVQKKTFAGLELPMVPELKAALLDYIDNGRPDVHGVVFLLSHPPYSPLSKSGVIACFRRALGKAKIKRGNRGCGPRAFRSSLASSMINDGVPYEAVRRTLGHIDQNAISHYARLDVERLRFYALPVPKASGAFADFLAGKGVVQ